MCTFRYYGRAHVFLYIKREREGRRERGSKIENREERKRVAVERERLEAHREWVDWRIEGREWGGGGGGRDRDGEARRRC